MVDSIMGMQMAQLQTNYTYGLMKRAMTDMESQAMSLINDMMSAVPAQYNFAVGAYAHQIVPTPGGGVSICSRRLSCSGGIGPAKS